MDLTHGCALFTNCSAAFNKVELANYTWHQFHSPQFTQPFFLLFFLTALSHPPQACRRVWRQPSQKSVGRVQVGSQRYVMVTAARSSGPSRQWCPWGPAVRRCQCPGQGRKIMSHESEHWAMHNAIQFWPLGKTKWCKSQPTATVERFLQTSLKLISAVMAAPLRPMLTRNHFACMPTTGTWRIQSRKCQVTLVLSPLSCYCCVISGLW